MPPMNPNEKLLIAVIRTCFKIVTARIFTLLSFVVLSCLSGYNLAYPDPWYRIFVTGLFSVIFLFILFKERTRDEEPVLSQTAEDHH